MADLFVAFDDEQEPGSKLAPEVVAEIEVVAPSTLNDGAVETPKLADRAVTSPKIALGGVAAENLQSDSVTGPAILDGAVGPGKLAADAVGPDNCAAGVMTIRAADGTPVSVGGILITQDDYDALGTPDPDGLYFTYDA